MTIGQASQIDSPIVDDAEDKPSGQAVASSSQNSLVQTWVDQGLAKWRLILLALLVIASVGLAASLFFLQYRPDQQTDEAAANDAIRAAKDGTVALLSYSPDSLDRDFAAGKSHLTGNFLTYYDDFTRQIVTPAARQKGVKTTAAVAQAAVSELHSDTAVVLMFINQQTISKDRPQPALSASTVKVTLTKANDSWLISSFDPV